MKKKKNNEKQEEESWILFLYCSRSLLVILFNIVASSTHTHTHMCVTIWLYYTNDANVYPISVVL